MLGAMATAPAEASVTALVGDGSAVEPAWITRAAGEYGYDWARIQWQRASRVPGAWFDAKKADAVVELWPRYFTLTDDRFAGRPFRLLFWQEVVVRLLVGWKAPVEIVDPETGRADQVYARVFRQLRLWIPRKNGKTEFLAALSLLFWALEGVTRGQGFCFAGDEAQARMVFDKMSDMISYAPKALSSQVKVYGKHLWIQKRKSAFRLLSGKPDNKHGRGPVVITGDEMHEWKTLLLMSTLRQGTGTRLQPIELYASTTGPKSAKVGYGLYDESVKTLDGTIDDATTLVVIFEAAEDDDWTSEEVWKKANPSLGLSPTLAFLRREVAYAKESPRAEAEFRCFHLNQWIDSLVRWLPRDKWKSCSSGQNAWKNMVEELEGRPCYLTIDASATRDITSLVKLFPPLEDGELPKLICRFWVPRVRIEERRRERVDYNKWHDVGALEATEGDAVDQDVMRSAIKDDLSRYQVLRIGRDPWNTIKLVTDLQKDGVDPELFVDMRQGHATLGEPTKEFERLVIGRGIDHGSHPVLDWMAGHCQVRFDDNLNFVPAKKKSSDKIDGIVASVMAVGLWMADRPEEASVYEERGIVEVDMIGIEF